MVHMSSCIRVLRKVSTRRGSAVERIHDRAIILRPKATNNTTMSSIIAKKIHYRSFFNTAASLAEEVSITNNNGIVEENNVDSKLSSPKLQELYDRIVQCKEEEVNILGALVLQILRRKIFPGEFSTGVGAVAGDVGSDISVAGADAVIEEEKTAFDVKLVGFAPKSKIKVIKEVRAIGGLGLKEAKELVESAPKIVQKNLKRDQADQLKTKLESLGAEIEIV